MKPGSSARVEQKVLIELMSKESGRVNNARRENSKTRIQAEQGEQGRQYARLAQAEERSDPESAHLQARYVDDWQRSSAFGGLNFKEEWVIHLVRKR